MRLGCFVCCTQPHCQSIATYVLPPDLHTTRRMGGLLNRLCGSMNFGGAIGGGAALVWLEYNEWRRGSVVKDAELVRRHQSHNIWRTKTIHFPCIGSE